MNVRRPGGGAGRRVTPLDLAEPSATRRNARLMLGASVVLAAALGGVVGLGFGRLPGVVAAVVVFVPLALTVLADLRGRTWLVGSTVYRRALLTRRVDIRRATQLEVIVTNVRAKRTVSILLAGPPRTCVVDKGIAIALASYAGPGGAELDVLALRKLADEFAEAEHSSGLVYSELLVAQLRAEARGAAAAERPLVQLALAAGERRMVGRVPTDALVRFVGALREPGEPPATG